MVNCPYGDIRRYTANYRHPSLPNRIHRRIHHGY